MLIGYCRVSTTDQNLDLQRDALTKAGCERTFEDMASGARDDRPGLSEALSHLRKGDTLVVWKLDRLGRTLRSLIDFVGDLRRNAEIVGDEDHGHAGIPLQLAQQDQHLNLHCGVERGRRLIG